MNTIFSERLKYLRKEKDISAEELATILDINKSTISRYETNKTEPFLPIVIKIANYFDVSLDWLAGVSDIRESYITSSNVLKLYNSLNDNKKREAFRYISYLAHTDDCTEISSELVYHLKEGSMPYNTDIKIVGQTAAGQPLMYGDSITKDISDLSDVPANADFALTVNGDSMEPLIKNGSIIYIHSQEDVENGTISIVELDGAVTCKKIYKEDNKLKLVSINEKYEPILIEQGNVRILGKVIL